MDRTRRLLALTAVGAFLLVGTAACGSSGGSDRSSDDSAKTTVADGASDTGTGDTAADDGSSGGGDEQDCDATADSNNLSGDSVVLFSADQDELSESDLADDAIATVAADRSSMDPDTIEIGAGEMFGFEAEDGGSLDAVVIGCAGGQTMVPGTAIGFVITEPGTYPVSLDVAGTDLGTVVVS
ncbi:MAG TPA: hypothetical protein VNQ33_12095 [Acidimicrobiales bacterium]|nr:hypothetical protein [Acidimicrobiales bacterium]